MTVMTTQELDNILELHKRWLNHTEDGVQANLQGADLRGVDLSCANLRSADLRGANLKGANLRCADLRYSNLQETNLQDANLREAILRNADLRGANLKGATLVKANFSGASTTGIDGALIHSMDNVGTYNGKVVYIPSLNTVWAGCWEGTPKAFYKRCNEVMEYEGETLNLDIAKIFVKSIESKYLELQKLLAED